MPRLAVLILVVAGLSGCAGSAPGVSRLAVPGTESLRLAQATASTGDHATAAQLFEGVLADDPENVAALVGAGTSYAALGQIARAEAALDRAVGLQPRNAEAQVALGRVKLAQRRMDAAGAAFDAALAVDGGSLPALTGKGVVLDALSRHVEAQAVYARGLKASPTNLILRSNNALSLALTGQGDAAIATLQELVGDPAAAPSVRGNLALVYGLTGREAEARVTMELVLSPADIEANLAAYRALRRMMREGKPIGSLVFL